jgi:hypothetical protein
MESRRLKARWAKIVAGLEIRQAGPEAGCRAMLRAALVLLGGWFVLAACGEEAPATLPPPPTASTSLVATSLPTPTLAFSADPVATLAPPPTMPPVPTSTPLPNTPTPEATATAEPLALMSPDDFGSDRNPLTGELVADPALLQRRPIAIKLSNSPASYTRPQSGLNGADWVYEHVTEGNITRFTIIIYGKTPPKVGPIRSARLIDVELPAMYDAALAFSGASVGVSQRLNSSDFRARIIRAAEYGYYRTGEDKPYEHTLYGIPEGFWQGLDAMGQNVPPSFHASLAFTSLPPSGGQPASQLEVDYRWTVAEWRYDAETGRYARWSDGVEHLDGNSGEQVTAANVIVMGPIHVQDATICEEIRDGVCRHLSVQIQIWGTGSAVLFRDGQRYDVTWQRVNRNDLLTFVDSEGNPFPLQIGNSWVQLVPTWLRDPLQVTG